MDKLWILLVVAEIYSNRLLQHIDNKGLTEI